MTVTAATQTGAWQAVCRPEQLLPDTGVCALVGGRQVAVFFSKRLNRYFAVDNYDPIGEANVLSRGIIGSVGERVCVASPLYKQHFDLQTGECLEEPDVRLRVYPVRLQAGSIAVQVSQAGD